MFGRLVLHPAREAFVEPEVVPPRHGDEIAEPLVRHFVREDAEQAAAALRGELAAGSNSRRLSKKVMPPQFSIAPPKPPGTAIRSSLGSGYFSPK